MISRKILRREAFGGMLVDMPNARFAVLDDAGYQRLHEELSCHDAVGVAARIVDGSALGYPLLQDALSTPGTAYFELTKRCDCACTHCYVDAGPRSSDRELTFAEIECLLQQLAAGGAYYIRLTGGEPTLRADLPDILDVITGEGMKPALNTHGRYDERTLYALLERGVVDIRISLDGTQPVNDAIRGPGGYKSVLSTLRHINEYSQTAAAPADPTINVVLMRSNRHCVGPLIELAAELGSKISFGLLRPMGKAAVAEMLSPVEVAEASREVDRRRRALGLAWGHVRINFDVFCDEAADRPRNPFPLDNSKCPIGVNGLGVSAEGRIMPCNYLGAMAHGRWLGECVCGREILDLWHHSRVLQEARRVRRSGCAGCPYYMSKCNGGCPATADALTGELDGRDPYCVREMTLKGGA